MIKKTVILTLMVLLVAAGIFSTDRTAAQEKKALHVVTTLPDYAYLAQKVGGDRITVEHIVHGVQDPHNIRPKPSFIQMVKRADLLVGTGLDLEMWLPSVIDKSGNSKVRSGENGFVAVSEGIPRLAREDKLIKFLEDNKLQGEPLINKLGGWMKKMLPLRGTPIVTFHKNWSYMTKLYGLEVPMYIEPKPGIPPSAKHVNDLINIMREQDVRILFCANYFDERKVKTIAERVDAEAIMVPLYVGAAEGLEEYFDLMDYWTDELLSAAQKKGIIEYR